MLTRKGEARRRLLASAAHASLLSLPLARLFRETEALAADAGPNIVFTYFPTGWRGDTFWPGNKNTGPITQWPGVISPIKDLGLERDSLLMYGLRFHGSFDHNGGLTQVLGGWGGCGLWPGANSRYQGKPINGMTLDQMFPVPYSVDNQIFDKIGGGSTINCGIATNRVVFPEPISWKKDGIQNKSENNPKALFDRLFAGIKPGGGMPAMPDDSAKKIAKAEKRVIDFLKDDLKKIEGNLSAEDKRQFQSHVAAIDDINRDIDDTIKKTEMAPVVPMSDVCDPEVVKKILGDTNGDWFTQDGNLARVMTIHRAIIVQALACSLTRICVLQIGGGHTLTQARMEGVGPKSEDHHSMSHSGGDAFMDVQRGHIREIAKIAVDLKNIKIGDKNMLDNTIIYGGSCSGDTGHNPEDVPSFVIGGGGKVKTGQLINLKGEGYSRALVTMAHLMGCTDINQVGNMKYSGPLKQIMA